MNLSTTTLKLFILALWAIPSFASQTQTKRKTLSPEVKKSLLFVLEKNETLHRAFFNYNGKRVETQAKNLQKAIAAIQDKEMAKLLEFSQKKLKEIKASKERDLNNQNYHIVSMALIYLVNQYDLGDKYNAYSCPMIKKKWIQNSKQIAQIHNPYAPEMPHCGTQDTHY